MSRFDRKVVFITGASSGIGAALAMAYAKKGADVALGARRVDKLEILAGHIRALGRRTLVVPCDVSREGELEKAIKDVRKELGRLDVAVANAGFGVVGPVSKLSVEDYKRQFETNVFGVIRTAQAAYPELVLTQGRFIIIGSVNSYLSLPGNSAYAMSKHAIKALADALFHEWRAEGVSVTLINPGFVESEIRHVDNQGRVHSSAPESPLRRFLRMPAEKCAVQIVEASFARKREKAITGHGKALIFIQRHFPWALSGLILLLRLQGRSEPR